MGNQYKKLIDGDFYIVEFILTGIGIMILLTGIFAKKFTHDTLLK